MSHHSRTNGSNDQTAAAQKELRSSFANGASNDRKFLTIDSPKPPICYIVTNSALNFSAAVPPLTSGRRNRCTDRFVKYPYPKCTTSNYTKEFQSKISEAKLISQQDAFNLEKETKIINPHPMEMATT